MKPLDRTAIAPSFNRALKYWKDAGYSATLSGMTMWFRHAIAHREASNLTRADTANLLHRRGWGPDDKSIWRPNNKLHGVKRYYTDSNGQLQVKFKRGYDRKTRRS